MTPLFHFEDRWRGISYPEGSPWFREFLVDKRTACFNRGMRDPRSLALLLTLLLLAGAITGGVAQSANVDQENWASSEALTFSGNTPAQEFTPTLASLDSVQVFMNGSRSAIGWMGGDSFVNIRQGSFDGPIVAASLPTYAPFLYDGIIGYRFSQQVPLVPGQPYVIEPVNRNLQPLMLAIKGNSYPGQMWILGHPFDGDLVFREGLGLDIVPEPTPILLLVGGVVLAVYHLTRGHFGRLLRSGSDLAPKGLSCLSIHLPSRIPSQCLPTPSQVLPRCLPAAREASGNELGGSWEPFGKHCRRPWRLPHPGDR